MIEYPLITVIITSYNYAHWIRHAIESVLLQTYPSLELLILDNASTDGTSAVVAAYLSDPRVRYIAHAQNIGMVNNHNFGIRQAAGEYIVFVSADDLLLPGYLEAAYAYLVSHPHIEIVYTAAVAINGTGTAGELIEVEGQVQAAYCGIRNEFACLLSHSVYMTFAGMLMRRDLFERYGLLEPSLKAMDYEIVLRWAAQGVRFAYLPEAMVASRLHENELSSYKNSIATGDWLSNYLFMLERYLVPAYAARLYGYGESIRLRMLERYKQAVEAGFLANRQIEERILSLSSRLDHFARRPVPDGTPVLSVVTFDDGGTQEKAIAADAKDGVDCWFLYNPRQYSAVALTRSRLLPSYAQELRFVCPYSARDALMAAAMFARGQHVLFMTGNVSLNVDQFTAILQNPQYQAQGFAVFDLVGTARLALVSRNYMDRHGYQAEACPDLLLPPGTV